MKVNLGVELDDAQRQALASIIAGKPVKRMASRDDVRSFLEGVVAGIRFSVDGVCNPCYTQDPPTSRGMVTGSKFSMGAYSPAEQTEVDRLVAEGRNPEYARGWISAGRVLSRGRKTAT